MACTFPQKCPLLSPRSRHHLPPGHASSFICIFTPSGVVFCGPSCSSSTANVSSTDACTCISLVTINVKLSSPGAVVIVLILASPPLFVIVLPFLGFGLGQFFHATQLMRPEAFKRLRPFMQR